MWLIVWLGLAIAGAMIASSRNRDAFVWFVVCACLPLIGLILVLAMPAYVDQKTLRTCPHCAEKVLKEAKVCKHCSRDLPELPPSPVKSPLAGIFG